MHWLFQALLRAGDRAAAASLADAYPGLPPVLNVNGDFDAPARHRELRIDPP